MSERREVTHCEFCLGDVYADGDHETIEAANACLLGRTIGDGKQLRAELAAVTEERDKLQVAIEDETYRRKHWETQLSAETQRREQAERDVACAFELGRTSSRELVRAVEENGALAHKALTDLTALRSAARALVEVLPKCDRCEHPATRAYRRGEARYCDVHGTVYGSDVPVYPRAAPLRAILPLLEET